MLSQWLIGLAGLAGVAAWIRAMWAVRALMLSAPDGEEFATIARLGLWQFKQIEQLNGEGSRRHIEAFKTSFIVFFAALVGGMVIGAFFWDPSLTPPDTRP